MAENRRDRQYLSGSEKAPVAAETDSACGCGRDHGHGRATRRTAADSDDGTTRRQVLGATAAGLSAGAVSGLAAGASDGETVTIVHDLHSHSEIGSAGEPNIARYQTVVQELLQERDDAIFVATGDELGSSLVSFFTEGDHKVEFMNEMGLTAVGVGNHDFDYGLETAIENFEASEFPWLTSNLKTPDGDQLPGTEPYHIEEINGIRVGIFNVVLRDFHQITSYPADYIQEDPVDVAGEMSTYLTEEEDCDVVVLASHVAHETHYEIAEAVDELDAIFGSHSHITFDEADVHHGTVISEIGYAYNHLGLLTLDSTGELVDWQRIDLDDEIEPDPEFKSMLEAQRAEIDDEVTQTVGRTALELDAGGAANYARESRLGNLITDAFLDAYGEADVAFMNAGGIRTNDTYGPGELTLEDVLDINPFSNELVTFEATGAQLRSALEGRIDTLPDNEFGAQPGQQVAGIQYEWRGHEDPEVLDVYVGGEPLDDDATYTVATTDYIQSTARGYEAFHDLETTAESGTDYGPVVAEYLRDREVVEPAIEGRILRVDEDVGPDRELTVDDETVSIRFDAPDRALGIYPETFVAITEHHAMVRATAAVADDDTIEVRFDTDQLRTLATGPDSVHLRVFGGFDPDSEAYGYTDENDELRSLPVSGEYFVLKGAVEDEDGVLTAGDDADGPTSGDGANDVDDEDDSIPGFGPLAGLAGLGAAGAYGYRKLGADDEADG